MNCINQNLEIVEGKVIIYQSKDSTSAIDVRLEGETVWLSANQMAVLFGRDEKTIRKHINNAIKEELKDTVVVAKFATTTKHGAIKDKVQVHEVNVYNLDVIISVGYRIKSQRGVEFRIWATKVLKEYLIKGVVINDKITQRKYEELSQLVHILGRTINSQPELSSQENLDLINVVTKAPIIAAPPKFSSFKYGILLKVTPPNATTFSSMTPFTLASFNISSVNADLYPTFEMLSKMGLKNK